jgi:polyphosphate kinase 2 (PPK2 family)
MKSTSKFVVRPGKMTNKLRLRDWDPDYHANKNKGDVEKELATFSSQMSELQYKLFADNRRSILIILQGVDASGKDSTIRHVMGALNPQGSDYRRIFSRLSLARSYGHSCKRTNSHFQSFSL